MILVYLRELNTSMRKYSLDVVGVVFESRLAEHVLVLVHILIILELELSLVSLLFKCIHSIDTLSLSRIFGLDSIKQLPRLYLVLQPLLNIWSLSPKGSIIL